jgi:acetolactate synthase-1/2/3 large subunit
MRVVDYIAEFLADKGINEVFLVTGGGAMFLDDAIAACDRIKPICMHHEQAAAMAATAYAKRKYGPGAAVLTTGCGGTNAITGVLNAYQDNTPCIFISGQTKRKETVRLSNLPLRQFGVQEADIIPIVQPITKYAVMLVEPEKVRYEMEKAYHIAISGRPGPVWIDVPMDVQGSPVDKDRLEAYIPVDHHENRQSGIFTQTLSELLAAERPIIVAGQGIKLSGMVDGFRDLIERYQIPYVASRLGVDTLPSDHPLFVGRIGNKGDRAGNFAVQNADYVLVLGSRLSVSSTGHEYHLFAREAKIVVVDIDEAEHQKNTVKIDQFIHADLRDFLLNTDMGEQPGAHGEARSRWVQTCLKWKNQWNIILPEYEEDTNGINLYKFMDVLSDTLNIPATVISDAGSCVYVVSQAMRFGEGQRYVTSGGQAEMGFSLPAAIGAYYASEPHEQIIAITGDGSLQMNIQELQTVVHLNIPVKLFVWNNDGYLSIRTTQRKFFEHSIGTDSTNGVSFPNLEKICGAYGLKYIAMRRIADMKKQFEEIYRYDGPVVCELFSIRDQEIIPSVSSLRKDDGTMISKPLEDMYPFLPRDEFLENMIVKPLDE